MCRLLAMTSDRFRNPMDALAGLEAMKEGYDGSGVGIFLRDLGGPFESMKEVPILSGIFTREGIKRLDRYMLDRGFTTKYKITFKLPRPPSGVPDRDNYLVRAYDPPEEWEGFDAGETALRLMQTRLKLKALDNGDGDLIVFSFWPDTVLIKEIGDPLEIGAYLGLDRRELCGRVLMVQGRQNTNYAIDLYACHPFFLQGFATMTNGENTAFLPNRDFLASRGFAGYGGYASDSETFTHILHYTMQHLGLGLAAFKHVITPLPADRLAGHPEGPFLVRMKQACRPLVVDGPNCVIGCLPDNSLFMVQDSKKLRPGVVGGGQGTWAFSSETCGLDAVLPDRDRRLDFQPMHRDTVLVGTDREGLTVLNQADRLDLVPARRTPRTGSVPKPDLRLVDAA